jgi:dTDP-glucose 4,6-dehydratase
MHVLVTGAAGFIGSNFVRMHARGKFPEIRKITVLDKLTYAGNLQNLEEISDSDNYRFVRGDICDSKLLAEILFDVDAVVNFAAESHVDRSISDSDLFIQTNITGVHRLLESCRKIGKPIRFLQVSTDEVYGSIDRGSWDEGFPLLPNSPYSASKASGELLARSYFKTYNMDILITRASNNYGPYQFKEKLIPLFVTNTIQGLRVPLYGNGSNIRDWLHVDDHCKGIYLSLTRGIKGEIYNIGGGEELSNFEIATRILESLGLDNSFIDYVQDRKGHDFRYSINCDKARDQLGYFPDWDFREGLSSTISWYQENQSWWK